MCLSVGYILKISIRSPFPLASHSHNRTTSTFLHTSAVWVRCSAAVWRTFSKHNLHLNGYIYIYIYFRCAFSYMAEIHLAVGVKRCKAPKMFKLQRSLKLSFCFPVGATRCFSSTSYNPTSKDPNHPFSRKTCSEVPRQGFTRWGCLPPVRLKDKILKTVSISVESCRRLLGSAFSESFQLRRWTNVNVITTNSHNGPEYRNNIQF